MYIDRPICDYFIIWILYVNYFIPLLKSIYYFIVKEGTVKFFNESKGYGFIKDSESENEYFVHVSELVDRIKDNDKVTYDLKEGRKGLNAVNVKLAE